jgi:DNA-directed RNA polymerase specialized sigma24 family protein
MSRGRALQHYGKLGVANLSSEVKAIWYSRHIEPEPCEPVDTYWPTCTDPDLVLRQDFARRLVAITPLTEIEEWAVVLCVLDNCTLREAGQEMDRTQERVRQILMKAMRKFRTCQATLTGVPGHEVDTRDMTWSFWKWERRREHDRR